MREKILLVSELWASATTHIKGWDRFNSVMHHSGADKFNARPASDDLQFEYMLSHEAAERFPIGPDELAAYSTVILGDIGSNTLILPKAISVYFRRIPNRLKVKVIRDYVARSGGPVMAAASYSFQGIGGGARYSGTLVHEVLPVKNHRSDDQLEISDGSEPVAPKNAVAHPKLADVIGARCRSSSASSRVSPTPAGRACGRPMSISCPHHREGRP